ncbi:hypothetical protein E2C01_020995 [Portunus trituberculatus]|uniref:Uncharacterized protein n=1 Tax=Portunus trituberculatus TaxID=210409 RepID=A0A5B7E1B9_PORTR|nr:hypothetical protein [Portunus trituberculatus]
MADRVVILKHAMTGQTSGYTVGTTIPYKCEGSGKWQAWMPKLASGNACNIPELTVQAAQTFSGPHWSQAKTSKPQVLKTSNL